MCSTEIIEEQVRDEQIKDRQINNEQNIFSKLPEDIFTESNTQISRVMNRFRELFIIWHKEKCKPGSNLPKLIYTEGEDSDIEIQLRVVSGDKNLTSYFAFELDESESSYGLIWFDKQKGSYFSKCLMLENSNIDELIKEILFLLEDPKNQPYLL